MNPYVTPADQTPPRSNPAGGIALVLGVMVVAVSLAATASSYSIPRLMADQGWSAVQVGGVLAVLNIVQGLLALGALVAGIIGLRQQGAPKGAAGAGTAIGAWGALGTLVGVVTPMFLELL